MAKKKPVDLVELTERNIRKAVDQTQELSDLPEEAFCETVLSAIDLVRTGLEMRQQELRDEAEE